MLRQPSLLFWPLYYSTKPQKKNKDKSPHEIKCVHQFAACMILPKQGSFDEVRISPCSLSYIMNFDVVCSMEVLEVKYFFHHVQVNIWRTLSSEILSWQSVHHSLLVQFRGKHLKWCVKNSSTINPNISWVPSDSQKKLVTLIHLFFRAFLVPLRGCFLFFFGKYQGCCFVTRWAP